MGFEAKMEETINESTEQVDFVLVTSLFGYSTTTLI
jgi:hypothetical protein